MIVHFKARRADTDPATIGGLTVSALRAFQSFKNHFRGLIGPGSGCVGPVGPEAARFRINRRPQNQNPPPAVIMVGEKRLTNEVLRDQLRQA